MIIVREEEVTSEATDGLILRYIMDEKKKPKLSVGIGLYLKLNSLHETFRVFNSPESSDTHLCYKDLMDIFLNYEAQHCFQMEYL